MFASVRQPPRKKKEKMIQRSIGICLGASNIKVVELVKDNDDIQVARTLVRGHESNLREVFKEISADFVRDDCQFGAITGRKLRHITRATSITEPEAIEYALAYDRSRNQLDNGYNALVSLGSESFIAYFLNRDATISSVETGNKCASGTGEFFLQQIRRMNISVDEAVQLAMDTDVYRVSGRCSVFCKSDCTHALNKGIPIGRVTSGLCQMMAEKVIELLEKADIKKVIAIGGVTKNTVVMDNLRDRLDGLYIPQAADCFEALGAAYFALTRSVPFEFQKGDLFLDQKSSFTFLPPIKDAEPLVTFESFDRGTAKDGDECILGLDVGSTTTKAVLLRTSDDAVLASEYLRTNGDPIQASRQCYRALDTQTKAKVDIIGLGITGSGRHIAGLHASTTAIINEIIAHATGAAFFDPGVDTIFEIGGQDAKYTYLTNGVPSDYAMNEACSAGTGSFLEESAMESLGIRYTDIEHIALDGCKAPNFNDQCAAFISSDIKTATHEGLGKEEIVAGLVYSICMNYTNRVKGQRPIGKKIFMQGGVCHNKAVPLAMANLIERPIIIPPDPGLIGAFGVSLEVKNRIENGLLNRDAFSLAELADREISYGKSFICKGGKERCDRHCEIAMPIINDKKLPFGGACNRFYNKRHRIAHHGTDLDIVRRRQELLFSDYGPTPSKRIPKKIGISRSYYTNTFYPLFHTFFSQLGCEVVLSDGADADGQKKRRSSFCYPGELAHGFFANLLKKDLDYIFLPKIMSLKVTNSVSKAREHQATCVLLQSEAYYLKSAFKDDQGETKLLTPVIDFSAGMSSCDKVFLKIAREIGVSRKQARQAFRIALDAQRSFLGSLKTLGKDILQELENDPSRTAVVLFGRSYNALASDANMGIPTKFASRNILVIPWDCLPFDEEPCDKDMCWAIGQELLRATSFVAKHPQLFGAFVTNFSCGPDSFLVGYFRDIMKTKPSLTIELDSHTADAGINTRIEAFLDIVQRYLSLQRIEKPEAIFNPAQVTFDENIPYFISSENEKVSFFDKRVRVLIPSMGRLSTEALAAAFQGIGVRSKAVPVYEFEDLKLGRANASCKECLPLLLTTGGLLKYLNNRTDDKELLAYFMPYTPGNCRFPQYRVFLSNLIKKQRLQNVALFSLNAEDGYLASAFTGKDRLNVLKTFIVADVMEDIKNAIAVLATDKKGAMEVFEHEWERIISVFNASNPESLYPTLEKVVKNLAKISLRFPLSKARKVALMGEVFVRRDYFSCQDLVERLAACDIIVKRSDFFEWLKYVDTIVKMGVYEPNFDLKGKIRFHMKLFFQSRSEKKIKNIFLKSGLYDGEIINIEESLDYGKNFFDVRFRGESILVVGNFFKDMLKSYHGVISIGPFACMPTRVIEAVLSAESTLKTKIAIDEKITGMRSIFNKDITELPFLSIESDGNPFPQIVDARIETFCLQVERLHGMLSGQLSFHQIERPRHMA
ncbi:MAG: activase [Proteobacteria bacterium]|nr:activase [Pseudomonadota bacterium]